MDMTQLAANLFAGPQIEQTDLATLAADGFTDVVCNRPDDEHPEGATSTTLDGLARELGLVFHYLPITPGEPFSGQAQELLALVAQPKSKVFAYCRSGARSAQAWSLANPDPQTANDQG